MISWAFITKDSTSLECIWNRLRAFYGFRRTGSKITELMDIRMESGESREALWERLWGFMESNLLTTGCSIKHEGADVEEKGFTPIMLNTMVVIWLNVINPGLPALIRHHFSTHLREQTIFSIRSEISDAIPSLLSDISEKEGAIHRSGGYNNYSRSGGYNNYSKSGGYNNYSKSGGYNNSSKSGSYNNSGKFSGKSSYGKKCSFCEVAGKDPVGHYLSSCPFLPAEDKKFLSRVREIAIGEGDDEDYCNEDPTQRSVTVETPKPSTARRVDIISSPVLTLAVNSVPVEFTLDCGAETSLIAEEECQKIGAPILPTSQRANMADGTSALQTVGETHFTAVRDHHSYKFSGLVVRKLDCSVLAGMPFLKQNDVYVRYSENKIHLGDCCTVKYPSVKQRVGSRRVVASVLRIPKRTCLLPGQKVSLPLPDEVKNEVEVALEPRCMSAKDTTSSWLKCSITTPIDGYVDILNSSEDPVILEKHSQFCQVRPVVGASDKVDDQYPKPNPSRSSTNELYSSTIQVDPSNTLPQHVKDRVYKLHKEFDTVFSSSLGRYNGYSGEFKHVINMGESLPPQGKARIPMYNKDNLVLLQQTIDDLHAKGVFGRPEDLGVSVEYVHPSFLLKKSSGGYRLVTSFGQVADFAKPQPTVTSNVEDVIQQIGQYKYLLITDLKTSYYQFELSRNSLKYVGIATPYRGTLIYLRSVMGLPGSEAALEEILNRILGDLIMEGVVVKLADDLYVGSNTYDGLVDAWARVLKKFQLNGLKLSPAKTIVNPTSTIVLGWLWEQGTIRSTPHRLNALAICDPPTTIKGLRSFIGCYKFLSRVLPFYADALHPLEDACCGNSSDKIVWSDQLTESFEKAKKHLDEAKTVVLPQRNDQLHIVTDAATRCSGIASALYVVRLGERRLAGYFNAKKKPYQATWIPCEVEALSIGCSIRHFAPYIVQSLHRTRVLTDSRPCVLAYKKLCRGEFSASPRVSTFLSTATRFNVEVLHISGKDNQFSDFLSRNPVPCNGSCQVCDFVAKTEDSVVGVVTVSDILSGNTPVPFATRTSWYQIQQSCPDLSLVSKYLKDGISPARKKKGITNIRRYMNSNIKLSSSPNDRLLIVPSSEPFEKSAQRIVVPASVCNGLLEAMHSSHTD